MLLGRTFFHNSVSSKRSGVAILVRKKIHFVLMNQHKDKEGRLLCIEAKLNDVKVVLCNVYATNKEEPEFFHEVNKIVANLEGYVILGGDFNRMASWTEAKTTSDQSLEIGLLFTLSKMSMD